MTWNVVDFVILTFVTYRITRFISLDSLIEELRDWATKRLLKGDTYIEDDHVWPMNYFKRKALQWIECPYCQSVWVAAGVLWFWTAISDYDASGRWVLDWLGISGAAMMWYRWTDPSPPCLPTKKCD